MALNDSCGTGAAIAGMDGMCAGEQGHNGARPGRAVGLSVEMHEGYVKVAEKKGHYNIRIVPACPTMQSVFIKSETPS